MIDSVLTTNTSGMEGAICRVLLWNPGATPPILLLWNPVAAHPKHPICWESLARQKPHCMTDPPGRKTPYLLGVSCSSEEDAFHDRFLLRTMLIFLELDLLSPFY